MPIDASEMALEEHVHRSCEAQLVVHVLCVLTALLGANRREIAAMLRERGAEVRPSLLPIGQVLRRTLPALRIGIKWVKGHLEYIAATRTHAAAAAAELEAAGGDLATDAAPRLASMQRSVDARVAAFWGALLDFVNLVRIAFPFDLLPNVAHVDDSGRVAVHVAEDDDLCELGPIRRAMHSGAARGESQGAGSDYARVIDVLIDAKVLSESPGSGIVYDDVQGVFVSVHAHAPPAAVDEDPISLAMQAVHGQQQAAAAPASAPAPEPTASVAHPWAANMLDSTLPSLAGAPGALGSGLSSAGAMPTAGTANPPSSALPGHTPWTWQSPMFLFGSQLGAADASAAGSIWSDSPRPWPTPGG